MLSAWNHRARIRGWLAGVMLLVSGCRRPLTELVVTVDTDLCGPAALDRIVVTTVAATGTSRSVTRDLDPTAPPFPLTLSVVDDGAPDATLTVRAEGWRAGASVVTQQWHTAFVPGESRTLSFALAQACLGVDCGDRTCRSDGVCADEQLDPQTLAPWTGAVATRDAACGVDAVDVEEDHPCSPDVMSDPAHCGACDHACTAGIACVHGVCDDAVLQVSGGMQFLCALIANGRVYCWGEAIYGELGDGTTTERPVPGIVPALTDIVQLAGGAEHACALTRAGIVWCWGRNTGGELGNGTSSTMPSLPVAVPGLTDVVRVVSGSWNTCAVRRDGSVWCWGLGAQGQLGDGLAQPHASPTQVPGLNAPLDLECGGHHCCAVDGHEGTVSCWGLNDEGQIGDGSTVAQRNAPVAVALPEPVRQVVTGYQHSCALAVRGVVYCWGDNGLGQQGRGVTGGGPTRAPGAVSPGLDHIVELVTGALHTCARRDDGTLRCWGRNASGQLGDGTLAQHDLANPVTVVTGATAMASGYGTTCAITAGGHRLLCWGDNSHSEVGADLVQPAVATPVEVIGLP